MKRLVGTLQLLFACAFACALAAHTARGESGTVMTGTAQASNVQPTPVARATPAPTPVEEEAHITGDIEIVQAEIVEKNEQLLYELGVLYPQIARPRSPQERGFNRYVRELIERDVREFRRVCAEALKESGGRHSGFRLRAKYKVLYATPRLLSVRLTEESYTGYLNSDWYTVPLNYDLEAGRPLKLSGLFRPGAKHLEQIAAYAIAELERRGAGCGVGPGVLDPKRFREGTRPTAENYEGWNLTRRGILITFGEYQIGPGCLGLVTVVVPYEQLREVLRADAPLDHVG